MKPENHFDVSLVMPAYNEEDLIEKIIAQVDRVLQETALRYELIIVDDGSHDTTWKRAMNSCLPNGKLKVVGYPVNQGKGYAVKQRAHCSVLFRYGKCS